MSKNAKDRTWAVAAAASLAFTVLVLGMVSMVPGDDPHETHPAVAPSASVLARPADQAPAAERVPAGVDGDVNEPEGFVEDIVSETDRATGVAAAVEAMRAFTARTLPHEQWWAALEPHLTPEAAWVYASTDPWKIPATQVTDDGLLAGAPDGTFLQVLVGTDAGQYRLEMVRQSVEHPWLVLQLHAPEGTK